VITCKIQHYFSSFCV